MRTTIQTKKQVEPQIYAYTLPAVPSHEGWIKIGYTEREVQVRVNEQVHTSGVDASILWHHAAEYVEGPYKGINFKDHDFHQFLKYHEVERKPRTEWFYFNGQPERAEGLFNKFIRHDTSEYQPGEQCEYVLRREQEEAVDTALAYFQSHEQGEFLWNAKPRFGKTLATYDLVKRLDIENVLVLTNRPAVANSWYDDFHKFMAGNTKYKFVSSTESLKHRTAMSRDKFMEHAMDCEEVGQIVFISLQDLKGSIYFGGQHEKLDWVAALNWDLVIIDESHEGVDTWKTDFAFKQIQSRWMLHLSGTPFKSIGSGRFGEDQIYHWSYADEQRAKRDWDSSSERENPYESLPELNMFTYQMSHMITDVVREGVHIDGENYDFAFDLNEFFATKESGEFIHVDAVKAWLDTLTRNEKYPFSTKELRNELKHTFWLLDRVDSAKALKRLLEEHPTFENYGIVLAAGSGNAYTSDEGNENLRSLEAVRTAIKDNERTITLSVGQLTTGVTVPEWTGVMMLCNMKSPALYMQAAFRAQNPYAWVEKGIHYRKERAYVFDFAPERTLIVYDQFANDLWSTTANGAGTSSDRKENIGELLNFFPVIAEDTEGRMVEIDATQVLTIPRQIKAQEVVKRGFMSNFLFDNMANVFRATQAVLDILEELPVADQGRMTVGEELAIEDVELDADNRPVVPEGIVVNRQGELFGDRLRTSIEHIESTVRHQETKPTADEIIRQVTDPYIAPIVREMKDTYGLKNRGTQRLEKEVKSAIEDTVRKNDAEQAIAIAHTQREFTDKMNEATSEAEKEELIVKREEAIRAVEEEHQTKLADKLKDTLENLPKQLIRQQEEEVLQKRVNGDEEKIRGHLRGFARTIPSFLMAYGDANLTLDNFDTYVDEDVFLEVTGITLEQFRYLRDGGEGFAGQLFNSSTFNESIQEFLRKKVELANYFEDRSEDIFNYIPPQQTNQIFTPKKIVKQMVDALEVENPHIFEDSSKTFIDLYMKSGLYIAEIVKRLYNNPAMKAEFSNDEKRLAHILEHQVYGFAPSTIIYKIAMNFIFGPIGESVCRDHFVQVDTIPYAKKGTMQELVDSYFG